MRTLIELYDERPLENVLSTATHFVLKKYKQDGAIVESGYEDDRMSVS